MRSRIVVALAALAALAGCRVEGGSGAGTAADATARAGGPAMPGPGHTVFGRKREVVAPGLARVTVSAIVRMDAGPDSARSAMERLLAEERRSDTIAAAIRVLGYLPPPQGHGAAGRMTMIPLAFTDWAPEPGFDSLGVATRNRPYRTTTVFVHDAATLRGMSGARSPGGAAPQLPRGTMPPGGPAPRRP
jgi:hypothetical protein